MFRLASPWFLAFLTIFLPALFLRYRKSDRPALRVSSLAPVLGAGPSLMVRLRPLLQALKYTALLLMILAMARPQWGTRQESILTSGINIVLAVDLSESMMALDFRREGKIVDRLEAVKGVVADFIAKRGGDRIGLVVFGTEAYTQLPLTRDYNSIASVLERLEIGAAGKMTAIGDAIGISLKRLSDIESESNIIILLTDGQSNAGQLSPEAGTRIAAEQGVKIYTIGVGTRGRAPFLVNDPLFGRRYIYQQVDIDEKSLQEIAQETGGLYFRAEDTEGLEEIYETIDRLEKTELEMKVYAEYNDLYPWLLIPAFALIGLWMVLAHTRFLEVP